MPLPADLNIDGIVDLGDWGILNTANPPMGQAAFAALQSRVPEPAAWMMGAIACGLELARRRRRDKSLVSLSHRRPNHA
jgi:hypothetical protein